MYFDDIGFNQTHGVVCSGLASDVCCYNYSPLTPGGEDGSEANGVGSWVYPDGSYVRYNCSGCADVEEDNFQIVRTRNTTILYQNENTMEMMNGIYRCEIPLNISESQDFKPLVQYVGIYERGKGK